MAGWLGGSATLLRRAIAHTRGQERGNWAGEGWLPRERAPGPLNGDRDTTRPRVDRNGTSAAR
jgi:hypothetical protein